MSPADERFVVHKLRIYGRDNMRKLTVVEQQVAKPTHQDRANATPLSIDPFSSFCICSKPFCSATDMGGNGSISFTPFGPSLTGLAKNGSGVRLEETYAHSTMACPRMAFMHDSANLKAAYACTISDPTERALAKIVSSVCNSSARHVLRRGSVRCHTDQATGLHAQQQDSGPDQ